MGYLRPAPTRLFLLTVSQNYRRHQPTNQPTNPSNQNQTLIIHNQYDEAQHPNVYRHHGCWHNFNHKSNRCYHCNCLQYELLWDSRFHKQRRHRFIINNDVTVRSRRISSRLVPNSSVTCSWILRISIIITVSCNHDDKKKNAINWIEYLFSALAASRSHTAYCTRIINSISFRGGKLLVGLGAFFM